MNYKLALELKKAGFPQGDISSLPQERYWSKEEVCYIPTLSELIEACGKKVGFEMFEEFGEKDRNYKVAVNYPKFEMARGKTPEGAVAKLYIKLDKKDE